MFDVTAYGAVGDGTTDDRSAIQDAIDAAGAAGGGIVYFPKGDYLLDSVNPTYTGYCLVVDYDNIFIQGEGRGVSIIRVGDNQDAAAINFSITGIVGGGINSIEIDGNRANNAGGHGIRGGMDIHSWTCRDVYVHDTYSYGIGLQYQTGTTPSYKNITIDNVIIEDTGLDGFDCKNLASGNQNNKMSNVTVRRFGLRSDVIDQAGIDLRGGWELVNIGCFEYDNSTNNAQTGIRFRFGESDDEANGYGGHTSTLTNFHCIPSSTSETYGVYSDARKVMISNGYVEGCGTGYFCNQSENLINNCTASGGVNGFLTNDNTSLPSESDRTVITGCVSRSNSAAGFIVRADNTELIGVVSRSNGGHGIYINSTANNTTIQGESTSNTANYTNNGTGTYVIKLVTT